MRYLQGFTHFIFGFWTYFDLSIWVVRYSFLLIKKLGMTMNIENISELDNHESFAFYSSEQYVKKRARAETINDT